MTADVQGMLRRIISENLGVPDTEQIYINKEEMP